MLRTTISKLRQVCALTFVPRLLRGDIRFAPDRFEKLSVCVQRKVDKSTNSSKQDQDNVERCQRIIDRAFSPPSPEFIDMDTKHKESFLSMVTPDLPTTPENQCEKCKRIISQIFGEENAGDRNRDAVDPVRIPITELQATTAKESTEILAQKIEHVEETPLVEAPAKTKVEGFNTYPKVLGNRKKRHIGERICALNFSSERPVFGRRKGSNRKDGSLDDLAKRCLDSPSSRIDERLLKEIEKLGVPPASRKGSKRTTHDAGIVQPEIMKRPRRPVAKTELDFLTMNKATLLRLNSDLPPPFELTPCKASSINLVCFTEDDNTMLTYERIRPLKEKILSDVVAMPEDSAAENLNPVFDGREEVTHEQECPPQRLLGRMTAAVMSDESNSAVGRSIEMEQVIDQQEKRQYPEESPSHSRNVLEERNDEKISLAKLKELEDEHEKIILREKLASSQILSKLVDPKEISPRSHSQGMIREEIDMLQNLLRTRVEYLTQEKVKRLHPKDNPYYETAPAVDSFVQNDFTKTDTDNTSQHRKEDLNVSPNDTPTLSEPSAVSQECTDAKPLEDTAPYLLKSYSQKQKMVTPHQLFEELSSISRETEIGVLTDDHGDVTTYAKTDTSESAQEPPGSTSPRQFIENVGMVSKDNSNSTGSSTPSDGYIRHSETINQNQPLLETYDKKSNKYDSEGNACENDGLYSFEVPAEGQGENKLQQDHTAAFTSEPEDPVMAVEMGRLPTGNNESMVDHTLVTTSREPVLQKETPDTAKPIATPETILNPLLDKGTVAHISAEKLAQSIPAETTTIPTNVQSITMPKEEHLKEKPIPLSEMLKRVRERNRLQFCKQYEVRMAAPEVEPLVGGCGKKQPPCPPPAPTCPPPPQKKCPPEDPPCPNPCKPKCPPTCPPTSCEPKPKCPPAKKSPCEKFQKCKCSEIKIQDALTLLLYLGPQLHIPQKPLLTLFTCAFKNASLPPKTDSDVKDRVFTSLHNLCTMVLMTSVRNEVSDLEPAVTGKDTKDYAKTYDPWTPIPSWPIPVKVEKRKLVCPKEGCKVAPPKLNAPCRDINPCINFPKKHFSIIDFLVVALRQPRVMCDIGEF